MCFDASAGRISDSMRVTGVEKLITSFSYDWNFHAISSEGSGQLRTLAISDTGQPLRKPSSISRLAMASWAGPTLTHLDVTIYNPVLPNSVNSSIDILKTTAPFLRSLTLRIDFQRNKDTITTFPLLQEAVSHLKTLTYFSVGSSHLSTLLPLVDHLPSSLRVLRLDVITAAWEPVELTSWCLTSLELPCLRELRRWRFSSLLGIDTTTGDGALWLAKCEERGIEVRDDTRYFIGARIVFNTPLDPATDAPFCVD